MGVFCLALVPANTLPKTPLGGIHLSEIKQLYLEGGLHPCNVLMCPHTCVTNLPKPRQKQPGELPSLRWRRRRENALTRLVFLCRRDRTRLCDGWEFGVGEEDSSGQRQRPGSDRRQRPGELPTGREHG